MKRKKGATLSLVVIVILVIICIGVGAYFLVKILGSGREMANATDSGALNIAKQATRNPGKPAAAFPNPDVLSNFGNLGENPNNLDLIAYNRCVAHAAMVALNAKEENTVPAAQNALKVWNALKDVGAYLRTNLQDKTFMGPYFTNLAGSNSLKMGGNLGVSLLDYAISFMKRGQSTNIYFQPSVLAAFPFGGVIPQNTAGSKSPSGDTYVAGYQQFSVDLPAGGYNLSFSGVPVMPSHAPHLVSLSDFVPLQTDSFITGTGSPGYPANTLPPNSFKSAGQTTEAKSATALGAIACAIVGCLDKQYGADFRYGYIIVHNGDSAPAPPNPPSKEIDDIFAHELTAGITTLGASPSDPFTTNSVLWMDWYKYNTGAGPQPSLAQSQVDFRKGDGTIVTLSDLQRINTNWLGLGGTPKAISCAWVDYNVPEGNPPCVACLNNFKIGYNRPGSTDSGNIAPNQFTNLERFKIDVQAQRYPIVDCVDVQPIGGKSGVKWFDHGKAYPAPSSGPYNFGVVKSAWDYLQMIDQVSGGCGTGSISNAMLRRCQQMVPGCSAGQLQGALASQGLPLGATLYLFNSGGTLACSGSPPATYQAGLAPDGIGSVPACGQQYPVLGKYVNASPNGGAPNDGDSSFVFPFGRDPGNSNCTDEATWSPSSGYNNLLGELEFANSCQGGGMFCKPN